MNNCITTNWTTWMKWINSKNIQSSNTKSGESENLNRQITPSEIEAVIKNSQETKALDQMASQVNFTKHSEKN